MSGNSYQKYKMQRIRKETMASPKTRRTLMEKPGSVHVTVSQEAAAKILSLSNQTRIPSEIVAVEAMLRGFALLNS